MSDFERALDSLDLVQAEQRTANVNVQADNLFFENSDLSLLFTDLLLNILKGILANAAF